MKLTDKKRWMLGQIASSPRSERHFQTNNVMKPATVKLYLDELVANGLAYVLDDKYHISTLGRNRLDAVPIVAQPKTIVGKGRYKTGDGDTHYQHFRQGSNHSHLKSFGF